MLILIRLQALILEQEGLSWSRMVYPGAGRFILEQDGLSWSKMVFSGAGWFILKQADLS